MNTTSQQGGIIRPPSSSVSPITVPSASFFGILTDSSAYRSLMYLLLLFPLGIFTFVYIVTLFSLSVGLSITIIGLPLLYVFLMTLPKLLDLQAAVATVILGVDMPTATFEPPTGSFTSKLLSLLGDRTIHASILLNLFIFPLGIFAFVFTIISTSVSFALMMVVFYPLVRSILIGAGVDYQDYMDYGLLGMIHEWLILSSLALTGLILFIVSLHIIKFISFNYAKLIANTIN